MSFAHRPGDPLHETSHEDLVQAREQADAGLRLAFPMLFEQAAEPEKTEIPGEVVDKMAPALAAARERVLDAGRALPLAGYQELHHRLNELVNEVDRIGAVLAEKRGDG